MPVWIIEEGVHGSLLHIWQVRRISALPDATCSSVIIEQSKHLAPAFNSPLTWRFFIDGRPPAKDGAKMGALAAKARRPVGRSIAATARTGSSIPAADAGTNSAT